jgi:ATP-dependent DNA helicase RecG
MVETNDGFKIAEVDLKLRGPGDMQGTQQSGILNLRIADIVKDESILRYARADVIDLLEKDPNLESKENLLLKSFYKRTKKDKPNWGIIS